MRQGIIYCATNKINGKRYIGQTIKTLDERITDHYCPSSYSKWSKFKNALKKYKREDFNWEILQITTEDKLDDLEIYFITFFDSKNNGYNTTDGGEGFRGGKHSLETRLKMSKSQSVPKPYRRKDILMYDYYTNELLGEYKGINITADKFKINRRSISNNLKGLSKKVNLGKQRVYFKYK